MINNVLPKRTKIIQGYQFRYLVDKNKAIPKAGKMNQMERKVYAREGLFYT